MMKKLLLLFLLIPTLLMAQSKEEKELEKRVKGMTKDKAEAILMQAKIDPPRQGGWELIETRENVYIFKATDNKSNDMQLFARVFIYKGKLCVGMTLEDPARLMPKEVTSTKMILAKAMIPAIIDSKKYLISGFEFDESIGALLNLVYTVDKSKKTDHLYIGSKLVVLQTIDIITGYGSGTWKINNPEALYAAALMLKPGLTYKEFLVAAKDNI